LTSHSTTSSSGQAHLNRDPITIRSAVVSYEGATLEATGSIPLALLEDLKGPAKAPHVPPTNSSVSGSLHATVSGITPSVLRGLVDPASLEDVAGTVDAAINLESPSMDPSQITGDLTLT